MKFFCIITSLLLLFLAPAINSAFTETKLSTSNVYSFHKKEASDNISSLDDLRGVVLALVKNEVLLGPVNAHENQYLAAKAKNSLDPNSPFTVVIHYITDENPPMLRVMIPNIGKVGSNDSLYKSICEYNYQTIIYGRVNTDEGEIGLQIEYPVFEGQLDTITVSGMVKHAVDKAHEISDLLLFSTLVDSGVSPSIAEKVISELHGVKRENVRQNTRKVMLLNFI